MSDLDQAANEYDKAQSGWDKAQHEWGERHMSRGLILSCTDRDWALIIDFITNETGSPPLYRAVAFGGSFRITESRPEPASTPGRKRR